VYYVLKSLNGRMIVECAHYDEHSLLVQAKSGKNGAFRIKPMQTATPCFLFFTIVVYNISNSGFYPLHPWRLLPGSATPGAVM
jgi:hypothetical protein